MILNYETSVNFPYPVGSRPFGRIQAFRSDPDLLLRIQILWWDPVFFMGYRSFGGIQIFWLDSDLSVVIISDPAALTDLNAINI